MTDDRMNDRHTYYYEGDISDLQLAMKMFRFGFKTLGGLEVMSVIDHGKDPDGEFTTDTIEYRLDEGAFVVIKMHDTESELEVYISIADNDKENAAKLEKTIREDLENIIHMDKRMGFCCE